MGIDIGGPVGTPCMVGGWRDIAFGYNPAAGDYGNVLVRTRQAEFCLGLVRALRCRINRRKVGRAERNAGEVIAAWSIP